MTSTAPVEGWTTLTGTMLDAAYHAARPAPPVDIPPIKQCHYGASAVIAGQAALETFINEQIEMAPRFLGPDVLDVDVWRSITKGFERASVVDKWRHFPRIRYRVSFDEGAEPFQSFVLLVKLRNALAHHSPVYGPLEQFPQKGVMQALSSRYAFSEGLGWSTKLLNLNCSRWACDTAVAMIKEFARLTGTHDLFTGHTYVDQETGRSVHAPPVLSLPPWQPRWTRTP